MWSAAGLALLLLLQQQNPQAEGIKALEEQRYDAAAIAFSKAVAADPKDYSAHFHLALAQSLLNRDAEAIAGYRRTLELKPELYEAQLNLGMVLLRQKQIDAALPLLEAAARKKPKEPRPLLLHAEALLGANRYAEAATAFLVAADLDAKSAAAQLGVGRALARDGRIDEGAPYYARAIEMDASYSDSLLELASLYEAAKRPKEAAELYARFPENPAARERSGELLLEAGEAAGAIPQLEAAVKLSPTPANRYALAAAYVSLKQLEKAEPLLRQAIEAEPGNASLRAMYGRVLREQKKYPAAAEQFVLVAKARSSDPEAWSDLAGMLVLIERYPEALGALDKVRLLQAEKPGHHYLRAIVLDKHQAVLPALESYEKFLQLSEGKYPDEEFKARQRVRILKKEAAKK